MADQKAKDVHGFLNDGNGFSFAGALNAEISGPALAEFRNYQHEVKAFSEWCRPDLTIEEFIPLSRQTMMVLFQIVTKRRLAYYDLRSKSKFLINRLFHSLLSRYRLIVSIV